MGFEQVTLRRAIAQRIESMESDKVRPNNRSDKSRRDREEAPANEMVRLGQITGVHGVQGWVKVWSETAPRGAILDYDTWYVRRNDDWLAVALTAGRANGGKVEAKLASINDRDSALELIGAELAVPRDGLEPTEEGEFYWCDLIGLTVVDQDARVLGTVSRLFETGANDVLVVVGEPGQASMTPDGDELTVEAHANPSSAASESVSVDGREDDGAREHETLIPFVWESVVKDVNLETRVIRVEWWLPE